MKGGRILVLLVRKTVICVIYDVRRIWLVIISAIISVNGDGMFGISVLVVKK